MLRVAGCPRLGRQGLQELASVGAFTALRELDVSHLDSLWTKPVSLDLASCADLIVHAKRLLFGIGGLSTGVAVRLTVDSTTHVYQMCALVSSTSRSSRDRLYASFHELI